ncbi:Outer membrane protein TolC [Desulfuromusa kysingii]|uniref:Outer membrane protein TolC n=1 Tax=Desulfuromusa kysingii TaxID=37625 RepID=A0A1H3ZTS8_9BACT|nr:TolC family protein [Desulfuromusa kysingii]SEA27025.1 Outer membrane protein TolC [Desulfuromusa kysingii]
MKQKILPAYLVFVLLGLLCLLPTASAAAFQRVTIGIAADGPWERNEEFIELFRKEIRELTAGDFEVRFPADKILLADWTASGARQVVDRLLADPQVDLLIPLGVLVSMDAAGRRTLPKPVISPLILDREIQEFPFNNGTSGMKNFTYLASSPEILRDLKVFHHLFPFNHLAILNHRPFHENIPAGRKSIRGIVEELGFTVTFIPVDAAAETALTALPLGIDAVYVTPLLQLSESEFERLVQGLIERHLPSFSLLGKSEVERGIMAGAAPATDIPRLARRTALNVLRILHGEKAAAIPVEFERDERLSINMATARAVGFHPRWDTLTEAELLHEERTNISRRLSLGSVVEQAITANLDLAAQRRLVAAGTQQVRRARSGLLPQLGIAADSTLIDADRAEASFGSQAERTFSGSLTLSQLLYSDRVWANFSVEKQRQIVREEELAQLRLDIVREATITYLNLLRAKTVQRIFKDNLKLTRSNLDLARARLKVGYSSPAEVYRWESRIASDRQSVIRADAQRQQAQIALNRLLHRPAEEPFLTVEVGLDDPLLLTDSKRLDPYIDNPWSFGLFRDFMVQEGLALAPELKQLNASIVAEKRIQEAAKRAFWAPDISLQGAVTHRFAEGGQGVEAPSFEGLTLSQADDTDWSLNLNLSLPLFTGGARSSDLARSREDLSRLYLQRNAIVERIDQRIRSALHQAGSSFAGIRLSHEAAVAARKNLDLVTDSYARGAVGILNLLDAQNAALVAEQTASNAVYNFLIDLMEAERATGRFDFFVSEQERQAWFDRLATFFAEAEIQ